MSARRRPFDEFDATDPRHGTLNGYHYHGCRCEKCREIARDYNAARKIGSRADIARPAVMRQGRAEPLPVTTDTITVARYVSTRFPGEQQILDLLGISA